MAKIEHEWITDKTGIAFCRLCLMCKRADGLDRPCQGKAQLRPMEILLTPEESKAYEERMKAATEDGFQEDAAARRDSVIQARTRMVD